MASWPAYTSASHIIAAASSDHLVGGAGAPLQVAAIGLPRLTPAAHGVRAGRRGGVGTGRRGRARAGRRAGIAGVVRGLAGPHHAQSPCQCLTACAVRSKCTPSHTAVLFAHGKTPGRSQSIVHACTAGRADSSRPLTGLTCMRRRAARAPWAGSAQEFGRWAKRTASWTEVHALLMRTPPGTGTGTVCGRGPSKTTHVTPARRPARAPLRRPAPTLPRRPAQTP